MQTEISFTIDLETVAGQAELRRLMGHLLSPLEIETPAIDAAAAAIDAAAAAKAAKRAARQQAAANARGVEPVLRTPSEDDLTGPEPNGADTESVEDMGLDDPNMSPAEAKEAGLALMRELFGAGKVAEMKAIQKAWGVAKFYDIPNEKGHEFYRHALQTMHETGLRK